MCGLLSDMRRTSTLLQQKLLKINRVIQNRLRLAGVHYICMCSMVKKITLHFKIFYCRVFARPSAAAASSADPTGSAWTGCVSRVATPAPTAPPTRSATTTDVKVNCSILL